MYRRDIWNPTYHTQRLNYCTLDGKECGLPVATHYCKMLGYERSDKVIKAYNVGLTNYLPIPCSKLKPCSPIPRPQCQGWNCHGFELIRCVGRIVHKPVATYYYRFQRFHFPHFGHYRLNWCYQKGSHCGRRTAYSFCRRMGYMEVRGYQKQRHVPATQTLGDKSLCFGNQCDGFREITCYR